MKIYLATSWKNDRQPSLLIALRQAGHDVYDFRNPAPNNNGFAWHQVLQTPPPWTIDQIKAMQRSPVAVDGFRHDMNALDDCDACVLLLPCGASAHLEAGYVAGKGKRVIVFVDPHMQINPELMWLTFGADPIATSERDLLARLK